MPTELSFDKFSEYAVKAMGIENARRQRILARSPHLAWAADAAGMSSRELAIRELKELGITPGNNDPEALLDAHHAGRMYAREKGSGAGEKPGSATDSSEASFIHRYINSEGQR